MFKENLREYTRKALGKLRVEVRTGEVVQSVEPTRVTLKSGAVLPAHTLVWGAGLQGNALLDGLGLELQRGKRIAVDEHLRVPSHPEVYAVGDLAAITDEKTEQVLPQLGSVALQSGEHAGKTIAALARGKEPKPFKYRDKGTMAMIGRGAAVVQMLGGRTMKGAKAQARLGRRAHRAAAHERGSRQGGRRLGRRRVHAPAHRADQRPLGQAMRRGETHDHERSTRSGAARARASREGPADVLVVFGITGDLAKVMTFRSLYRLERRGQLDVPGRRRRRRRLVGRPAQGAGAHLDRRHRRGARREGLRPLRRPALVRGRRLRRGGDLREGRRGGQGLRAGRSSTSRSRPSCSAASSQGLTTRG